MTCMKFKFHSEQKKAKSVILINSMPSTYLTTQFMVLATNSEKGIQNSQAGNVRIKPIMT